MRERDRSGYVEFVQVRYASLYRTAYLLTGNHHTAEDLVQTTLAKVYVSWSRVSSAGRPEAYARRMITNEVVNLHRHRWTTEVSTASPALLAQAGSHPGPEQAVVDSQLVWEALGHLPARQRAVVVLRYYDDLSEADIADALGIAPGTVKSHAHAALAALGAYLSGGRGGTSMVEEPA